MNLEEKYQHLKATPSDVNEHFDAIRACVTPGDVVVELGVREMVSTYALMANKPRQLISLDVVSPPEQNLVDAYYYAYHAGVNFQFVQGDSTYADIKYMDVLFIDTLHLYSHVVKELWRHAGRTRKYIIFHDSKIPEVRACIQDFLFNLDWKKKEEVRLGNGLFICERV